MQVFQLKESYRQLLEQDRLRCDRNDYILQSLERLENRTYALNARTDRLRLLKNHYEAYIGRHYQEWKRDDNKNASSREPNSDFTCSSNLKDSSPSTRRLLSRSPSLNSPKTLSLRRRSSLIIPDTELLPSPKYTLPTDFIESKPLGRKNLPGSTPSLNINTAHEMLSYKKAYVSNEKISPTPKLTVTDSYIKSTRGFTQEHNSRGDTWHTDKVVNTDKWLLKEKFDILSKSDPDLSFSMYSIESGRHPSTLSQSVDSNWSIRQPFKPLKPLTRSKSVTALSSYSYKPEPEFSSQIKSVTRRPFSFRYSIPSRPLSRSSPKSSVSSLATRSRSVSPLRVVDDIFKKYLINYDKRYLSDPISESKYGKYLYPPKNEYADLIRASVDDLSSVRGSNLNSFGPTFRNHSPSKINTSTPYDVFENNDIHFNSESKHKIPVSDRYLLQSSSTNNWKDWNHYSDRYEYQFQFGSDNNRSDNFNYLSNRDVGNEYSKKYDFTKPMVNSGSSFVTRNYSDSFKSYQHLYMNDIRKPSIQSALGSRTPRHSEVWLDKPIIPKENDFDYTLGESLRSPQTPKRVSFSNECLYLDKSDTDASQSVDEVPISNKESAFLLNLKSRDYKDTEKEEVNLTDSSVKPTKSFAVTESSQDNSLDNIYYDLTSHLDDTNQKYTSNKYSNSFSNSSDNNIKKNNKRRSSLFPNNDFKLNSNTFEYDYSEKDTDESGSVDLLSSKPMKEAEENKYVLEELGKPLEGLCAGGFETNTERVHDDDNNVLTTNIITGGEAEGRGNNFSTELLNTDDLSYDPVDPSNLNTVVEAIKPLPITDNAENLQNNSTFEVKLISESVKQNDNILGNDIDSQKLSNKDIESDQQYFKSTEHSEETVEKISESNPDYSEEKASKKNVEKQPDYENGNYSVLQEQFDQQLNQDGTEHDANKIPENKTDYRNVEYDQTEAQYDNYQQQPSEKYSDEKYKEENVTDIAQSNDVPVYNSEQHRNIEKSYKQQPEVDYQQQPEVDYQQQPEADYQKQPEADYQQQPEADYQKQPEADYQQQPEVDYQQQPEADYQQQPEVDYQQQPEANYQQQPTDYDSYAQEKYQHQQFKSDDLGQQQQYEQNYEGKVEEEYLPLQQDRLDQQYSATQYGDEYPQEYNQQPIQYQEEYQDQTHDSQAAVAEQYPTDYTSPYQNDPLYQTQPQDSQIIQDQFRGDYETNYQNETQYQDPKMATPIQEQYETDLNMGYQEDLQYQGQMQDSQNMPEQYVGDYKDGYQENPQFQGELQALPNNQERFGDDYDSTYQKDPQYQYEQEGAFDQTNIPEQYDQYNQQISEPYDQQYQGQPEQFSNYEYGYNDQGGTDQTYMEESQHYNTTMHTDYGDAPQTQNDEQLYTANQGTFGENPQLEDTGYETQINPSHNEYPTIENPLQTNSDPVMNIVNPTSYSPTPVPNPSGTTPNINQVLESDSELVLTKEGAPQEDSSDFDFSSEHK